MLFTVKEDQISRYLWCITYYECKFIKNKCWDHQKVSYSKVPLFTSLTKDK